MNDITVQLTSILSQHLRLSKGVSTVPPDADLATLGLDSMAAINLLLDLEQGFELTFPDSALNAETFRTLHNLQSVIEDLLEQKAA